MREDVKRKVFKIHVSRFRGIYDLVNFIVNSMGACPLNNGIAHF